MRRSLYLLPIVFLIIFAIAIYANTLNNGFVYDDRDTIVNNILIKGMGNLPRLFHESYFALSGENSYRPVVTFTYFLDYALFGMKAWGFHLTNVMIHAVNGALLYIFLTLSISRPANQSAGLILPFTNLPLLISLLFAAHPISTETVNAVSFREDLLVFFFYAATLILYLRLRSTPTLNARFSFIYLLSCLTYFFALLSKEMAVTLPIVIYCYEWSRRCKEKRGVSPIFFNRHNIGYITVTFAYLYLRFFHFRNPLERDVPVPDIIVRLKTIPWLLANYFKLTLFPASLSADYMIFLVNSFFSLSFIVPFLSAIFLIAAALAMRKRKREIAFGILFFLITLIPVYNIALIPNPFAERYVYLPVVGIVIIGGSVIHLIHDRLYLNPKTRSLGIYAILSFFIILGIFSVRVLKRNEVWRDDYSLWSYTVRKLPNNAHSRINLGITYADMGRFDEAVKEIQTALRLKPNDPAFHYTLGNVYVQQRRFSEAVREYNATLQQKPAYPDAHYKLGAINYRLGEIDEAIEEYHIAVKQNPYDPMSLNDLGVAYAALGQYDKAVRAFRTASSLNPSDPMIYNNLGLAYANMGSLDEAIQEFKAALMLNVKNEDAHYNLGVAYLKKGLKDKAVREFEITLELKPDDLRIRQILQSLGGNMK